MSIKKNQSKTRSVMDGFKLACKDYEVIKAFGNNSKGDTLNMHKSTGDALAKHGLVK